MRHAAICLALGLMTMTASAAPRTGSSSAAPPSAASSAPAASSTPDPSSPYSSSPGSTPSTPRTGASAPARPTPTNKAAAPAAPAAAPAAAGATVSGDPLLDAPPTSRAIDGATGLSPLNPEANEFPARRVDRAPPSLDALLSEIATLRSRVAALTTSLFSSKLRVYVHTDGDDARVDAFVMTLDDGVVFRSQGAFVADDEKVIYEHAVAPGNHVLGVQVERHDTRGKAYRTWQSTRVSIVVPDRKVLELDVTVEDDSDMAEDFPDDEDGEYDMDVRVRARVVD